mmetsp:Transcript_6634/g.20059  ORF Transcript_6634/g.20059 Transcript_6634/m.20059 type:complete len:377 (+) Transcript_6634:335-1465(+)
MQPITAMVTPGRWPVDSAICSVTSCRSNSVRPQLGHDTYSVLTLRMRLPCSSPNAARTTSSVLNPSASSIAPSPRPSHSSPPANAPVRMSRLLESTAPSVRWWITGSVTPSRAIASKMRREACTRLTSAGHLMVRKMQSPASSSLRRPSVASSSVPLSCTTERSAPFGSASPASWRASASSMVYSAIEAGTAHASRAAAGAITPRPASWRRLSVRRASASSSAGTSSSTMVSTVATSLKGMPTASLQPSCWYSASGVCSCSSVTRASTEPSRCSTARRSTVSSSRWLTSSPRRRSNLRKSRAVSVKGTGVCHLFSAASVPRLASVPQGTISSSGSSVRLTRIVSPRPSMSSEPMPMADFMRPSSPSPASVTPRCMG